jgi:hypothetical protein
MSNFLNKLDNDLIDDNRFICPICSDEDDSYVTELKCGHKFCRKCIIRWYLKLNNLVYSSSNYANCRECPVCRQNGGYLKLLDGEKYIKDIYEPPSKLDEKKLARCGAPIKTKPGKLCTNTGHTFYGGYCGKHKKIYLNMLS